MVLFGGARVIQSVGVVRSRRVRCLSILYKAFRQLLQPPDYFRIREHPRRVLETASLADVVLLIAYQTRYALR